MISLSTVSGSMFRMTSVHSGSRLPRTRRSVGPVPAPPPFVVAFEEGDDGLGVVGALVGDDPTEEALVAVAVATAAPPPVLPELLWSLLGVAAALGVTAADFSFAASPLRLGVAGGVGAGCRAAMLAQEAVAGFGL